MPSKNCHVFCYTDQWENMYPHRTFHQAMTLLLSRMRYRTGNHHALIIEHEGRWIVESVGIDQAPKDELLKILPQLCHMIDRLNGVKPNE